MDETVRLRVEVADPPAERVTFCGVSDPVMPKGEPTDRLTFPEKLLMLVAVRVAVAEPP